MTALRAAVDGRNRVVFPCAFIAGDVVILAMLKELGLLGRGDGEGVEILVVDTHHLFPQTLEFIASKERDYSFKAAVYRAVDTVTKADYDRVYGADLWRQNIGEYDRVAKVEPFQRGLRDLGADCMISGRRRDHGADRASLEIHEGDASEALTKVNPLAHWTFENCFEWLEARGVPAHPLHEEGYPSIGDAKDTVPVPREKWFEYGGERSGRFQGLPTNADGSKKTECGIHVDGAERTFERDLWDEKTAVFDVAANDVASQTTLVVVYAPWCPFCQAVEATLEAVAQGARTKALRVAKYRGDTNRDFVSQEWGVQSFPTLLRFAKGDSKPTVFGGTEDERTVSSIARFLEDGAQP